MVRIAISVIGTCLLGAVSIVAQYKEFDQEASLRDSECDNGCFFDSFPGGSCTDDAACMCNQQRYRERYFCCMAKKCLPHVVLESLQRQWSGCEAHGVPINYPEDFDFMAVCGVELSTTSTTMEATSTSAAASTATSPAETTAETSAKATADPSAQATSAAEESEAESSATETSANGPSSIDAQSATATAEEASGTAVPSSGGGAVMPGLGMGLLGLGAMML
ncbi:hypothetical protein ACHAQA_008253 [Verticillium albo-atrum]